MSFHASSDHHDSAAISQFLDALSQEMTLYGYQIIETPIIAPADLFLTRAGDELIERLFTFERHGQQLALRPEFTAAAADRYNKLGTTEVVRWQFAGPIFEDDSLRHGYQHLSVGAELLGMSGSVADAEIISLAVKGVARAVPNYTLIIGNIGLLKHLLKPFYLDSRTERFLLTHLPDLKNTDRGIPYILDIFDRTLAANPDQIARRSSSSKIMDALDVAEINTHQMLGMLLDASQRGMTMGGRTREDIVRRLLQKHQRFTEREQVTEALAFLEQWVAIDASVSEALPALKALIDASDTEAQMLFAEWEQSIALVEQYDISLDQIVIRPHIARNWDYYTGMVFEVVADDRTRLAGGGRYDELVSLIGGQPVPAVGFAYYIDQILPHLPSSRTTQKQPLIILADDTNQLAASQLAHKLRQHELPAVLLTQSPSEQDKLVIRIENSGQVTFQARSYTAAEQTQLIADIQQALE